MRVALGIEYDGASYSGWQSQPDRATVQGTLESALGGIAGGDVRVVCAGRTDAGVHALEQVVHFDTTVERPASAWVRGTNANLPAGIAILWAIPVTEEFHARFSAVGRSYQYVLMNRAVRPALGATGIGWFHAPLDLDAMRNAARCLLGTHDFSAFRSSECQANSPVREMRRIDIEREGDIIRFSFEANAFLHHMIRNIVGCLVYVGKGRFGPDWLADLLAARDRNRAAPTFAPHGLYLTRVTYAAHWALPVGRVQRPEVLPVHA